MTHPPKVKNFIANLDDDNHCLQASYIMLVEAITGVRLTMDDADAASGFAEGVPTWPFQMFLSLADLGLGVVDYELFDAVTFADDAYAALYQQTHDDAITREMLSSLNVPLEQARVKKCLTSPAVKFVQARPSLDDISLVHELGGLVVCNVNSKALKGEDGYLGHMVVVDEVTPDTVVLQDPGLPPVANLRVTRARFNSGWLYPSDDMANIIGVFPTVVSLQTFLSRIQPKVTEHAEG